MIPLSLYIHIPWCIRKCPYCDFNSHAVKSELPEQRYVSVLLNDLEHDLQHFAIARPINSIFIGGGTPSLFSPEALNSLLEGIKQKVGFSDNPEITLEANPGTFELDKFAEFRALGINRLSIGVQSFNDTLLQKLGRVHSSKEAIRAAETAHQVGFNNFNLDLMFGLPATDNHSSRTDVEMAIKLNPAHISFYQLTLEPNTLFHKFPPQLPDDEHIYAEQQACQQELADHQYGQYEISAYSKPGFECRHNLNYWQFGDYLGIGAGAHGKISTHLPKGIFRTAKPKSPEIYQAQTHLQPSVAIETDALALEFLMNQLRLKKGFTLSHYERMTGLSAESLQPALAECLSLGLISHEETIYKCSEKGWNFLDSVLEKFIR
ncbi:MAG: radical SAM family heme chaperone HemW [Methylicorpusculum sp.]|uniref:radical SAM family heme chaperone HemW n=2 Tax=Methylicorpusculum sp. TaxID=2713644 RepID=UPI002717D781|nr:radical SAM family heme chaperone HemW [Methylicorpusculum sp.]MDO8940669.1 radical SAM family heme chaperone HemW [Methylicorpusculum sp.]MDP2202702.1 radical SAM family heme chaperone HemW [Methylicorpusculum sp.]